MGLTKREGHPPLGTAPYSTPAARSPPQGTQAKGTVRALPPHSHTPAHSTWVAVPDGPPRGRKAGGGGVPELRRSSQRRTAPRPGDALSPPPQCATTARKGKRCGAAAGSPRPHQPHPGHTGCGTLAAHPPKDGQQGEGQRLTPDAPRSSGRPPPRDGPPPPQQQAAPHRACKPRGQCWAPTPAHPRPQHAGGGPRQPPRGGQPGEGERLTSDAPGNGATHATRATGGAPNAHRSTQTPARGASVRAPPPKPHRAHDTCTGHGKSALHPLLLGTAIQQWRNPRPHANHAPGLQRWTRHTRSSGRWDSGAAKGTPHRRTRAWTPTWRKSQSPRRTARPRNPLLRRAACPPSALRRNGATAPEKTVPQATPLTRPQLRSAAHGGAHGRKRRPALRGGAGLDSG